MYQSPAESMFLFFGNNYSKCIQLSLNLNSIFLNTFFCGLCILKHQKHILLCVYISELKWWLGSVFCYFFIIFVPLCISFFIPLHCFLCHIEKSLQCICSEKKFMQKLFKWTNKKYANVKKYFNCHIHHRWCCRTSYSFIVGQGR